MRTTVRVVGRSIAGRLFSILLTSVVTVLALYLFDEAWTEYRYQIRVATQNVDVIGEDPYKVVYFTDIPKRHQCLRQSSMR